MRLAGSDKDERASLNRLAAIAIEEKAVAARDDVHFVSPMRLLWITHLWRVELHLERAMREDGDREIAGRRRSFLQSLR
jgi:hypothetical protein